MSRLLDLQNLALLVSFPFTPDPLRARAVELFAAKLKEPADQAMTGEPLTASKCVRPPCSFRKQSTWRAAMNATEPNVELVILMFARGQPIYEARLDLRPFGMQPKACIVPNKALQGCTTETERSLAARTWARNHALQLIAEATPLAKLSLKRVPVPMA